MSEPRYFNKQGKPITLSRWVELFEDPAYKIIKRDETPNGVVSTIWLGLDHSFEESGKPLIFETMIFESDEYPDFQKRYSTLEEAIKGHEEALMILKR